MLSLATFSKAIGLRSWSSSAAPGPDLAADVADRHAGADLLQHPGDLLDGKCDRARFQVSVSHRPRSARRHAADEPFLWISPNPYTLSRLEGIRP